MRFPCACVLLLTAVATHPARAQATSPDTADPYRWLEQVSSPRAMAASAGPGEGPSPAMARLRSGTAGLLSTSRRR